ncbi:aminotransferase-like domain-containing protein [Acinetobacter wuhouensis]|uniref:PLP-dependent aminotransferase family protein n=1 Tax=Acinetobacter wuhouensis TaxID=1879050 RepID=A0A3G2T3Y2_9GAMM|nr:PLP-dependent aminotransferase family protein [Acinetobacter wuhouensis]AYO54446.1 PLP-dependent aminotransferase family protein [Acinetobacter wuhouensis]
MAKTKIDQTMQIIQDQIANKSLIVGSRLPSVRQFAIRLNCSVSTVVEAYARLVAEGVLESRLGSGYYVLGKTETFTIVETEVQYQREVDPLWISRQSLDAKSDVLKPGCGWLPSNWMPEQSIRKALKQVAKSENILLTDYATPHGHLELRQLIARKKEALDLKTQLNQIFITDSATQSIDLIFRHLLQAGDVILIDDPCYFNFRALIQAHHLKAVPIPFTDNGPDVEKFEQALNLKPKIYLTNSGIHNPTGGTVTLQTVYQISKLVEQANMLIVEDEIFSDFEYTPAPRYAALAGLKHVIQIGSFTKTLSAAVRCGYIIAESKLIDQLIDLRIATNFSNSHLNAEIVYQALIDGSYPKHLDWLKKQLNKAMNDTIQKLAVLDIHPLNVPTAGIFLWCKLPIGIQAAELSKLCLKSDVILAPGNSFSQAENAGEFMRFNVAQCIDKKVFDVLDQAIHQLKLSD